MALLPSYQLSQRAKITHRHMQHSHQQHAQHRLNNAATGTLQMQQSATSAAVLSQSVAHPPQRQLQNFESGATIDHGGAVDISEGTMSENIATSAEVLFPDVSQSASAVRVTTHPTTMTSRTLHHIPSTTHPPRQQDAHYAATAASMMSHRMFGHSNNITTHVNTSTQHMSNHPDSVAAMALAYKNSKKRKLDLEQAAAAEAGVVLEDPTMVPNAELRSPRGVPQIKHSSRSPEAPLAFVRVGLLLIHELSAHLITSVSIRANDIVSNDFRKLLVFQPTVLCTFKLSSLRRLRKSFHIHYTLIMQILRPRVLPQSDMRDCV